MPSSWTCQPGLLWNLLFPGIEAFVDERKNHGQSLRFLHYASTDGWSINCLFTVEQAHRRFNVNGFSTKNYRHLIDPKKPKPLKMSDFTVPRKPYQGSNNSGAFHGKGNIDYMVKNMYLQLGPEAVENALQHIWITIDTGIINPLGGCVVRGKLLRDLRGKPAGIEIKFTRFLFKNKGRYSIIEEIVEEQTEVIQEFQDSLAEMSENHSRTMDLEKYEKFTEVLRENYKDLTTSNRSQKALMNGLRLKVWLKYLSSYIKNQSSNENKSISTQL